MKKANKLRFLVSFFYIPPKIPLFYGFSDIPLFAGAPFSAPFLYNIKGIRYQFDFL